MYGVIEAKGVVMAVSKGVKVTQMSVSCSES